MRVVTFIFLYCFCIYVYAFLNNQLKKYQIAQWPIVFVKTDVIFAKSNWFASCSGHNDQKKIKNLTTTTTTKRKKRNQSELCETTQKMVHMLDVYKYSLNIFRY